MSYTAFPRYDADMMHIYVSECEAGPAFPTEVEAYGSEKGQLTVDDITNVLKKLGGKMWKPYAPKFASMGKVMTTNGF